MNKGKIIAAGSPEELINKYGSGKRQVMVSDTLEDVFVKLVGAQIEDEGEMRKGQVKGEIWSTPSIKRIFADLSVFRREYLRNRTGFFFALVFPVILIVIFGAIFSGGSSGPITVYAQNHDTGPVGASFLSVMNSTNVTQITLIPNNESLTSYLQSKSGAVGLYIPANFSSDYISKSNVNLTSTAIPQIPPD